MTLPLLSFLSTYSTKLLSRQIGHNMKRRFEDQPKKDNKEIMNLMQ